MTVAPDKPVALDAFGLPKITLGGKLEEDNRDHSRAPISSGGTITGKAFQTDDTDPRIVIDSNALSAHKADGTETIRIDVNTGLVSINAGSSASPGVQFVTSPGNVVISRIYDDTSAIYNASALTAESAGDITIIAVPAIGAGNGGQLAELVLFSGSGGATLESINAAQTEIAAVLLTTPNPSRVSLQTLHGGALEAVDVVDGHLILSGSGVEKDVLCAKAAFTVTCGVIDVAAAINNQFGQFCHYRQVRGNTSAARVTPASITVTTTISSVNIGAIGLGTLRPEGFFYNVAAAAAGTTFHIIVGTAA